MKTEANYLAELVRNSWNGPMWHGTNISEVLKGINWEKAFQQPAAGSHSIYELVYHMNCWRKFVVEQLKGNNEYRVAINSELDWPTAYEKTEASWNKALNELERNQAELEQLIGSFANARLSELVPGRKFTWYALLHGLIHHDIYHSAQISTLKR